MSQVLVAGEALIDFLPIEGMKDKAFWAKPGGSPLNVAVGLSRLGVESSFLGKLSWDRFGELLKSHLSENRVDLTFLVRGREPTALSFVNLIKGREPRFLFYGQGTADEKLTLDEIPTNLPDEVKAIHLGSLAMVREPCSTSLAELMRREHRQRLISFDPNIRPEQMLEPAEYRRRFMGWLPFIDLLKLSEADLSYISPESSGEKTVREWLSRGPRLIVVTSGRSGAKAYTQSITVAVETPAVEAVDTVGAGDAFTAGLLAALERLGKLSKEALAGLSELDLKRALEYAVKVAAITCTRVGADPPRRTEVGEP